MDKYAITYKEIYSKTIIVEAENVDDAISKVSSARHKGEISIDWDDFSESETTVSEYANTDGTATENQLNLCWHLN